MGKLWRVWLVLVAVSIAASNSVSPQRPEVPPSGGGYVSPLTCKELCDANSGMNTVGWFTYIFLGGWIGHQICLSKHSGDTGLAANCGKWK